MPRSYTNVPKSVTVFRRLLPWLFAVAVIANCREAQRDRLAPQREMP